MRPLWEPRASEGERVNILNYTASIFCGFVGVFLLTQEAYGLATLNLFLSLINLIEARREK